MSGVLHLLSGHPGEGVLFERCVQVAVDDDTIVLLAHAAVAAVSADLITDQPCWCVLLDDLQLHGLTTADLAPGVEAISYLDLVQLAVDHPLCQSWS